MDQVAIVSDKQPGQVKPAQARKDDPEYLRRLNELKDKYGEA